MTSQVISHIEYLIKTYNILVLILYSKLTRNIAALAVLMRFNDDYRQWLTCWATLYVYRTDDICHSRSHQADNQKLIKKLFVHLQCGLKQQ